MLTALTVASRPEFSVNVWTCRPDGPSWSGPECPAAARLVLVRAGRFQRRGSGGPVDLDPTVGYLGVPDEEEHFAHPHGGDACTSVQLRESSWARLVGDPGLLRGSAVYVDARLELAHRRLTAAVPGDVDYQLAEAVLQLVAQALSTAADRPTPVVGRRLATDRRLVERARAAIHDDHPAARGLFPLAELIGTSPYRLSRAFPVQLGVSLTRYRNRVRVGRAIRQLERDESTLADIAVSLGFADQAHLSRTVREHVGYTPAALRRVLHLSGSTSSVVSASCPS